MNKINRIEELEPGKIYEMLSKDNNWYKVKIEDDFHSNNSYKTLKNVYHPETLEKITLYDYTKIMIDIGHVRV